MTSLAEAQLAKSDTAEMHTYAGLGWALKVRVYGLRDENRNAAHAAVNGRREMLAALKLDPDMADATAGLGVYNYYVDTLSPLVKLLRIFMGIPGGDKQLGIKQMEVGMNRGLFSGRRHAVHSREKFAHVRPKIRTGANCRGAARRRAIRGIRFFSCCSATSTRSLAAMRKPRNIFTPRWRCLSPTNLAQPESRHREFVPRLAALAFVSLAPRFCRGTVRRGGCPAIMLGDLRPFNFVRPPSRSQIFRVPSFCEGGAFRQRPGFGIALPHAVNPRTSPSSHTAAKSARSPVFRSSLPSELAST